MSLHGGGVFPHCSSYLFSSLFSKVYVTIYSWVAYSGIKIKKNKKMEEQAEIERRPGEVMFMMLLLWGLDIVVLLLLVECQLWE
jgi:hypothetical protein